MRDAVATAELNGMKLEIFQEDQPSSPREDDNLCVMVCFHKRYDLGDDDHGYDKKDYDSYDELKEAIMKQEKPLAILPLYLYDHSGITMNTTGFSCPWDSGQVGFAFINQKRIDELGTTIKDGETYPEFVKRLEEYIVDEIKIYDQYLTGEIYGFVFTDAEGKEDSCWGFYGDDWKNNGMADHIPYPELIDAL